MKVGDWICPGCGDIQFARNDKCRKCGTPNPAPGAGKGEGKGAKRAGDWICPTCSDFQYARNALCRRCGTPNPAPGGGLTMRPGDWNCPTCHDLVFARNAVCRRCQTPNPNRPSGSRGFNPGAYSGNPADLPPGQCRFFAQGFCRQGDACSYAHGDKLGSGNFGNKGDVTEEPWQCPGCRQLVFPHFANCLNCKTARPPDAVRVPSGPPMAVNSMTGMALPVSIQIPGQPFFVDVNGQPVMLDASAFSAGAFAFAEMPTVEPPNVDWAIAAGETQLFAQTQGMPTGMGRARSRSPHNMGPTDGN